ncbi:MAG: helix-turn-helix transcriptional regulator [Pseudomonadota bacterium]
MSGAGERIKKWRKSVHRSQRNVGQIIGVSQGYIGDIEAGRSEPSREILTKLSKHFGLSADWVLTGEGTATEDGMDPGIAGRLRYLRTDVLAVTQAAVGVELGVSQGLVQKYESGRGEPSRRYLQGLMRQYGISANWVLDGFGSPFLADEFHQTSKPDTQTQVRRSFKEVVVSFGKALVK